MSSGVLSKRMLRRYRPCFDQLHARAYQRDAARGPARSSSRVVMPALANLHMVPIPFPLFGLCVGGY